MQNTERTGLHKAVFVVREYFNHILGTIATCRRNEFLAIYSQL